MGLTPEAAKERIDKIFEAFSSAGGPSVLPPSLEKGKVYEAWVLGYILTRLSSQPYCTVDLVGGAKVVLKSSPGQINRDYARFVVRRKGKHDLEVWTDVEFTTLSFRVRGGTVHPEPGDRHELDLAFVPRGTSGYPPFDSVRWGIECKNTPFEKSLARGALGVRRELSFLRDSQDTEFDDWPRRQVPADPPSVFSVFSTSEKVLQYVDAGGVFGVDFIHLEM